MSFQFSDTLDMRAVSTVLDFVADPKDGNKRDALRAALVLVDFGSQFAVGEPTADITLPMSLESALRSCQQHEGGVDWSQIVPLLMKLVLKLLEK